MVHNNNEIFGAEQRTVSIKEGLNSYIAWWPLFLVLIIVCLSAGIMYARYSVPKYMTTTSFLIKGANGGDVNSEDLIESALSGKREINLNNEMLLMRSASLMERVVAKNAFNISYLVKGTIIDIDIYKDIPFSLIAKDVTKIYNTYTFNIQKVTTVGGTFLNGSDKGGSLITFRWNMPFMIDGQSFVLTPKRTIVGHSGNYIVRWQPVWEVAERLSSNLTIKPYDSKTSVLLLSLKIENLQKGKDILNALFREFNQADKEERIQLSQSTVQFIDDRLLAISGELKGVEGSLENYQGRNQLIDIKGQSTQSLENLNTVARTIKDLSIQESVVKMISEYFGDPANSSKLVPSSLGINDATLSSLITQYNELQLRKERETPSVAPNSTVMQDINSQIGSLKGSIVESLNNIKKNLSLQQSSFQQQTSQYRNYLSTIPRNERVLQEIRRKQNITEGLYLYLLQKREESAISSTAASISNYQQIDPASGYGPVEPNKRNIITYTVLFGFVLAFGVVYIKNLLNDTISSKDDITARTNLPIIGQISHLSRKNWKAIAVMERNIVGEQFRAIRTNLSFLLKESDKTTILVTSTISNEGKSFVSLNLAAVFAMPGKKVAVVEFDFRQPSIMNSLQKNAPKGITDYLNGHVKNIADIKIRLDEIEGLDVYPSGTIPMNPADLLLSQNMALFFKTLKLEYDYIIVDSPPVGLVSDSIMIGKYCDMVLYILRHEKTAKKQLESINEMVENKTLSNVALILNGMKKGDEYGNYYGSGYQNGNMNKITGIKPR